MGVEYEEIYHQPTNPDVLQQAYSSPEQEFASIIEQQHAHEGPCGPHCSHTQGEAYLEAQELLDSILSNNVPESMQDSHTAPVEFATAVTAKEAAKEARTLIEPEKKPDHVHGPNCACCSSDALAEAEALLDDILSTNEIISKNSAPELEQVQTHMKEVIATEASVQQQVSTHEAAIEAKLMVQAMDDHEVGIRLTQPIIPVALEELVRTSELVVEPSLHDDTGSLVPDETPVKTEKGIRKAEVVSEHTHTHAEHSDFMASDETSLFADRVVVEPSTVEANLAFSDEGAGVLEQAADVATIAYETDKSFSGIDEQKQNLDSIVDDQIVPELQEGVIASSTASLDGMNIVEASALVGDVEDAAISLESTLLAEFDERGSLPLIEEAEELSVVESIDAFIAGQTNHGSNPEGFDEAAIDTPPLAGDSISANVSPDELAGAIVAIETDQAVDQRILDEVMTLVPPLKTETQLLELTSELKKLTALLETDGLEVQTIEEQINRYIEQLVDDAQLQSILMQKLDILPTRQKLALLQQIIEHHFVDVSLAERAGDLKQSISHSGVQLYTQYVDTIKMLVTLMLKKAQFST